MPAMGKNLIITDTEYWDKDPKKKTPNSVQ